MRLACALFVPGFSWCGIPCLTARAAVKLPIEVVGEDGTTASVTFDIPTGRASGVRSLWMQIHGLAFPDMASVQLNRSGWLPWNNSTVDVAELGNSYGGIGGGFATLKMNLRLPAYSVTEGANTIRFRFNHSDGVVSGFRVLALNLLSANSASLIDRDTFVEEDPSTWTPPLPDAAFAGKELWESAPLSPGGFKAARADAGPLRGLSCP